MEFARNMKRGIDEFDDVSSLGMKRRRSTEMFEVRLLISRRAAGSIIGKGGAKIQQLRSDYDANVRIPDCSGPERVMTIQCEDPSKGIKVIEQASQFMSEENDGLPEVRLLIHDSVVGAIIGRSGAKIKELRAESGANIRVYRTCCPQSTERCVAVEGDIKKIVAALEIIMEVIKSNEIRGEDVLFDPNNFDGVYAAEYGGYGNEADVLRFNAGDMPSRSTPRRGRRGSLGSKGFERSNGLNLSPMNFGSLASGMGRGINGFEEVGFQGLGSVNNSTINDSGFGPMARFGVERGMLNNMAFETNTTRGLTHLGESSGLTGNMDIVSGPIETAKVTIPNKIAGAIIGSGGSRIKQIRMQSKATIEIGEPDEKTSERVISITGDAKTIQLAQFLLQQAVRQGGASATTF